MLVRFDTRPSSLKRIEWVFVPWRDRKPSACRVAGGPGRAACIFCGCSRIGMIILFGSLQRVARPQSQESFQDRPQREPHNDIARPMRQNHNAC